MIDEKGDTQVGLAVSMSDSGMVAVPSAAKPSYLVVVSGSTPGTMHRLSAGGTRVGRSHENGVRFADPSVSRRHANFTTSGRGRVWLTDLGSTNGTYLNGTRIPPREPRQIEDGDRVQFGTTVVVKFMRLDAPDEQFQRALFERTVRDPLTALYNRAYFLDQIDMLGELGASRGQGLAVLMLDVDHFKKVNDTHGHDAGDAVLREVAAVLRESTRSEDLVARYGGEEFVAALPVATPDQALERAERVRTAIGSRRFAAGTGGVPLRVTASIGVAFALAGRPRPGTALITAADRCLYQAKNAGRDRVVFRVDAPPPADPLADCVTPLSRGL